MKAIVAANAITDAVDQYIAVRQSGFGALNEKLGHSVMRNMLVALAM